MTETTNGKKVLLVEDDTFLQGISLKKLTTEGYNVVTANSSEEAIKKLAENPDIILLDLVLPGGDGYEVLSAMKDKGMNTPVIVFSNLTSEEDVKRAKDLGAKEYMIKSNYTLEELVDKIKTYL